MSRLKKTPAAKKAQRPPSWRPRLFVIDVDGVMTTGQFLYSESGKIYKIFGPDDADGLALLRPFLPIHFLSSDKRGFGISRKRIADDMGYNLDLVSAAQRLDWIAARADPASVVYMGDGLLDAMVLSRVGYGICPQNASSIAKKQADYITRSNGGDRAVAEACLHLLETFFEPFNPTGGN